MNIKLLKKARKYVAVVDPYGSIATPSCKRVQVIRMSLFFKKPEIVYTSRKYPSYVSYKWAIKRSKDVIVDVAKEIKSKSIWYVFY